MIWLNWPNRITISRILLVAPFVICLLKLNTGWAGWRYLALTIFVLMAVSDALDGYLARRLKEETPLGRFLDPVGDKLLVTCGVVMLAVEKTAVPGFLLPDWVPVIAISKDLLVVIGFALIHATTGQFFVQPRISGKICTTVQLLMIGCLLVAPDLPAGLARGLPVTWWAASGLAVVAVIDYIRVGNRFASDYLARTQRNPEDD